MGGFFLILPWNDKSCPGSILCICPSSLLLLNVSTASEWSPNGTIGRDRLAAVKIFVYSMEFEHPFESWHWNWQAHEGKYTQLLVPFDHAQYPISSKSIKMSFVSVNTNYKYNLERKAVTNNYWKWNFEQIHFLGVCEAFQTNSLWATMLRLFNWNPPPEISGYTSISNIFRVFK